MKHSESIAAIAKALAIAQGEMKAALKDKQNPFFHSTYADLASVIDALREPFAKSGLSYSQGTEPSEKNEVKVVTLLMHESGEWLESSLSMPVKKDDAQGYGLAMTYARRYSLQAMCGQAAEDDDGNVSSGKSNQPESGQLKTVSKPESQTSHTEPDKPKTDISQAQNVDVWHEAMFKGGELGDSAKKRPHRVVLEVANKEYEFTCFSRPQVLKEHTDWSELLNLPCRFKSSRTVKDDKVYRNLLDLDFTLPTTEHPANLT